MQHAGARTLDGLQDLIGQLRMVPGLKERRPGVFYRGSAAFLHFHEDPTGVFADLKQGSEWLRYPVNNPREHALLLRGIVKGLSSQ